MTSFRFRLSSKLARTPAELWAHSTSIAGVNEELWPIHMSAPAERLDGDVPLGERLFVSRVTLFRVLLLDLHALTLESLNPGAGFHENSRTLVQRRWEHRRTLVPTSDGGTELSDEISFEPRLAGPVVRRIAERVFLRRHRVLRKKFGGSVEAPKLERF